MIADVDFDIISHLGYVQNIDLMQKGIYIIQLSLYCGDNGIKVAPVGLFSAPSSLDSFVDAQKLKAAQMFSMCEVDDRERVFRSRAFVIRYKDERHELNEGVHWRFTIPNFDLSGYSSHNVANVPLCRDLLQIKCELMFCPLKETTSPDLDLQHDIDKFIPESFVYSLLSTQNLIIQNAGTGVHEYFPIRFEGSNYLDLDCMIHCATTAVRYRKVSLAVLASADRQKMMVSSAEDYPSASEADDNSSSSATSGRSLQLDIASTPYSTLIKPSTSSDDLSFRNGSGSSLLSSSAPNTNNSSSNRASMSLVSLRRLSGMLQSKDISSALTSHKNLDSGNSIKKLKESLLSGKVESIRGDSKYEGGVRSADTSPSTIGFPSNSIENDQHSRKLTSGEIDSLLSAYSKVFVDNFDCLYAATSNILHVDVDAHWDLTLDSVVSSKGQSFDEENAGEEEDLSKHSGERDRCVFEKNLSFIRAALNNTNDFSVLAENIQEQINACNSQLSLRWSLVQGMVRKAMPGIQAQLKSQYLRKIGAFWKKQMLVHTKSICDTHRLLPFEEMALLNLVTERMTLETTEMAVRMTNGNTTAYLARALRVFDGDFHPYPQKIPYLVVQQYVGDIRLENYTPNPSIPMNEAHSNGVFDQSLKCGTVYLAFGGQLLHCRDEVLTHGLDIQQQSVVDVTPYISLLPIHNDFEAATKCFQRYADECDKKPGAKLTASADIALDDVTLQLKGLGEDEGGDEQSAKLRLMNSFKSKTSDLKRDGDGFAMPQGIDISDRSRYSVSSLKGSFSALHFGESKAAKHKAVTSNSSKAEQRKTHLIVLQHGFLGTCHDMRYLQNAITVELPHNIQVFSPKSNDEHTQDSIAQMAKRLAFEVVQYCKTKMPSLFDKSSDTKLSFIGHSMGGLMIRLALQEPAMKPLLCKLHAYVSLATPHIGTLFADSQIVSTGMWALLKFKKCRSLKELVLEDAIGGKLKKSLLYKLSLNGALSLFHKVILVSSPKDQYVPTYSARIQISRKTETDEQFGATIAAMTKNLLSQLRADQLVRVTLDNNIGDDTSVNTLIGRTAHICYLENQMVASQIIASLAPYFL